MSSDFLERDVHYKCVEPLLENSFESKNYYGQYIHSFISIKKHKKQDHIILKNRPHLHLICRTNVLRLTIIIWLILLAVIMHKHRQREKRHSHAIITGSFYAHFNILMFCNGTHVSRTF